MFVFVDENGGYLLNPATGLLTTSFTFLWASSTSIGEIVTGCTSETDLAFPLLRAFAMFALPSHETDIPFSSLSCEPRLFKNEDEAAQAIQAWFRGVKGRHLLATRLSSLYSSDYDSNFGF